MSPARLMEIATLLTLASRDTPEHQENLRRAVSTAYYAMFHTLANSNADTLIGTPPGNTDDEAAWNRTFTVSGTLRAIDHARQAIIRFHNAPPEIRRNLATTYSSATAPNKPGQGHRPAVAGIP